MTTKTQRVSLAQLEDAHANLGYAVDAFKRTISESGNFMPDLTEIADVSTKEMGAFMAVIGYASFTKAAKHLGMSQPGLTRQIQRLEKSLGHVLVARTRRGANITPQGIPVYQWCMDTLNGLQNLTAHRIEQTASIGAKK